MLRDVSRESTTPGIPLRKGKLPNTQFPRSCEPPSSSRGQAHPERILLCYRCSAQPYQLLILSAITSAPTINAETEAAYAPDGKFNMKSEPSLREAPNDLESEVMFAAAEREEHEVDL